MPSNKAFVLTVILWRCQSNSFCFVFLLEEVKPFLNLCWVRSFCFISCNLRTYLSCVQNKGTVLMAEFLDWRKWGKATEFVSFSVQRVFKLLLCFIKQSLPFFFIFLENGCEIGDPPRTNIIIHLFSYIFIKIHQYFPDVSFWLDSLMSFFVQGECWTDSSSVEACSSVQDDDTSTQRISVAQGCFDGRYMTGLTLQRTGNPWRQVSELNSLSVNPEEDRESLSAGFYTK